jgi:cyclophilin family peptidyl-prolyl cis-trans isomerase
MRQKITIFGLLLVSLVFLSYGQNTVHLKKKDRRRDVEMITTEGIIVLRLSDSTPLHRDNFLRLVKSQYFDSILFHRVIQYFMIQAGDPSSKEAAAGKPLGDSAAPYTIPAEFRVSLFHKRGVLAAARESDDTNPQKASSGSQFYIVQGKKYTDSLLDEVERKRLKRKIPETQREVYKTLGGTPQLDQNYTVFGEVVSGMETVDKIAASQTSSGDDLDRPVKDIRIISTRLIRRKTYHSY